MIHTRREDPTPKPAAPAPLFDPAPIKAAAAEKRKAEGEATCLPPDCRADRCRSCGAEIVWAKTESGKSAPFDLKLTSGQYTIDAAGVAHHVRTRVSHYATCPNANAHRRST
jgi:hypothetical protein